MKKKNRLFISLLVVSIVTTTILLPIDASAKTIAQFEEESKKLISELESKKNQIATNDAEVAEIKKKINGIKAEMEAAEREIESLQQEINASNEEIRKKNKESKNIIEYYQISNGENSYLEYVFGATSITDMIYRMSVVEQLTDYNDKVMKELEALIKRNQEKQEQIKQKEKELDELEKQLIKESERIEGETASIRVGMPSIEQQIEAAKNNVKYYKNLGCGTNEDIQACQYRISQASSGSGGSVPSVNGFYRPIEYGYFVRGLGGGHYGIDMSSSNKYINVYPIATGQLYYAGYDCAGALVVVLRHNVNGRYLYATYAHMRSFSSAIQPYVIGACNRWEGITNGPIISPFTSLGVMGSTGNSTGPHVHLEMSSCSWHKAGGCSSYNSYLNNMVDPRNYVVIPGSWNNR